MSSGEITWNNGWNPLTTTVRSSALSVLPCGIAVPDFSGHTEVINGFSDLMVQVFGAKGEHARSAIGVGSLPRGFAVEIEAVVEFS